MPDPWRLRLVRSWLVEIEDSFRLACPSVDASKHITLQKESAVWRRSAGGAS